MYLAKHRSTVTTYPLAADPAPPTFSQQVVLLGLIGVAGVVIYGMAGASTPRLKPRPIRRPKRLRRAKQA